MRYFVIPARGGSKAIPDKNLCDLGGSPLITWTIEAAKEAAKASEGSRVYVSSEDRKILDVSEACGAVPHLRPAHLADDQASMLGVLRDFFRTHEDAHEIAALLRVENSAVKSPIELHHVDASGGRDEILRAVGLSVRVVVVAVGDDHERERSVGLGGGSSMDTAKAVGLRVTHPGELREYEGIVGGGGKIKPVLPPLVCIPTTSGTGSEVNPCAVLTDRERDLKFIIMSNNLIPKLAVIDPLYCWTMPARLTVESGIDALAHCIEGYVSLATPYHPYFESMALYGVKLIGRSLALACRDGNDTAARTDMCMAAVCGGLAFLKGLGIGHAITHVLGAHYHLPHGRAALYGLLCFVKANRETCKEPFIDMAQLLNRSNDLEESLFALYRKLDISISLKALGIPRDDLKKIAFYASRDAVNMATDPTTPSEGEILQLLEEIYE